MAATSEKRRHWSAAESEQHSSKTEKWQIGEQVLVWRIRNFSCLPLGNGDYVSSAGFAAGGGRWRSEWELKLYPNGNSPACAGYVSLFLGLRRAAAAAVPLRAKMRFALLDRRGRELRTWSSQRLQAFVPDEPTHEWGWCRLIDCRDLWLLKQLLLPNDVLTVVCWLRLPTEIDS